MHCPYEPHPDGTFKCPMCGDIAQRITLRVCAMPMHGPPRPPAPSIFKKMARFSVDAIKHVAAGSPTCTQEQIAARLTICRACPGNFYVPDADNPELGSCSNCGCLIGREQKFLNKLGWSDQECPIGAWPRLS